jgi:hypothetical protein
MRPFLLCIHDVTPAHARATRMMVRDLVPLAGRRISFGVVPDWHGEWPLDAHPDYCRFIQESSEELLLHGFFHRRQQGRGIVTLLTDGSDEMNGLDPEETRRIVERGQSLFTRVFGEPARGFLAPGWQQGHVPAVIHAVNKARSAKASVNGCAAGLEYTLGFFSLESLAGRTIPLTTWSWDCGRWAWLGHVGHGIGRLLHTLDRGVPVLAIHPSDLERGYWPRILRLIRELLDAGYAPSTVAGLLEAGSSRSEIRTEHRKSARGEQS